LPLRSPALPLSPHSLLAGREGTCVDTKGPARGKKTVVFRGGEFSLRA
jgi:hypothetical protein